MRLGTSYTTYSNTRMRSLCFEEWPSGAVSGGYPLSNSAFNPSAPQVEVEILVI